MRMNVGILGGTGPAGRGFAARLAATGMPVTLGSRDAERAVGVAAEVVAACSLATRRPSRGPTTTARRTRTWSSWPPPGTARSVDRAPAGRGLGGKVVISMVNALVKEGREMLALIPPRGSMAAAVQAALPALAVAAAFHHLPASDMVDLDSGLGRRRPRVLGPPRGDRATTRADRPDRRAAPLDAGSLSPGRGHRGLHRGVHHLNIRHHAHSTLRLGRHLRP